MIRSISKSSLSMFLRCPVQWERRYVYEERIPPGIAARRGGAVHKAAQVNHEQKIISGQDLPASDLQDAARDYYVNTIKENGVFIPKSQLSEKNELLNEGLNTSVRLAKLYRDDVAPTIQPQLVEEKLEIDAGFEVPIVGIVDVYTADKRLPDFKSADKSPAQGIADTSLELTFYAGLVAHATGEWPAEVSLDYLVDLKKGPKYDPQKSHRGPRDWDVLMQRVQLMLEQIRAGIFPPCDPGSWVCSERWCGFALTCKWFKRR